MLDFQSEGAQEAIVLRTVSQSAHDTTTTQHLSVSQQQTKVAGSRRHQGTGRSNLCGTRAPWASPPGQRRLGVLKDSCEGSGHITQSELILAKPIAMVDGKIEPAGEGLPDGWLKECRPRRNRHGSRMKGDMYYIDPINGYEFSSLKDVHRYLESGDISQCVKLPIKRKIEDLYTAGDQSHHVRCFFKEIRQELRVNPFHFHFVAAQSILIEGEHAHTGKPSHHTELDTADESNRYNLPEGTKDLLNPESGENTENISFSKPDSTKYIQRESDRLEASEGKSIQSGSIENPPREAESVTRNGANVKQKPKEKRHRAKPVKGVATPLRSSPRLAALKINQEANNAPRDEPISTQADIINQSRLTQVQKQSRKANSSVPPEVKDGESAMSFSEKFEDNHPSVPNQIQGVSFPCSSGDAGCQEASAEAPVLQQQTGQGEAYDGMPGSALSSLFQHVWSDPCLVFAFRTLLSDIPVLDDTLAHRSSAYDGNRSYFLPPQTLNKGAAPNWSSSAYDGNRNHAQVDHVMPRPSDKFYGSHWFPPQ
ncbi:hypothetical protein U9M48_033781 [Paspalum notatum var. saurae]|uniref:MBD domain-containing protein n=1 Tax=Paspalum notatum var. saurae TaxID=547442 RepID=A0AAQ3U7S2_PASNO